jgi:hypothetical protein
MIIAESRDGARPRLSIRQRAPRRPNRAKQRDSVFLRNPPGLHVRVAIRYARPSSAAAACIAVIT